MRSTNLSAQVVFTGRLLEFFLKIDETITNFCTGLISCLWTMNWQADVGNVPLNFDLRSSLYLNWHQSCDGTTCHFTLPEKFYFRRGLEPFSLTKPSWVFLKCDPLSKSFGIPQFVLTVLCETVIQSYGSIWLRTSVLLIVNLAPFHTIIVVFRRASFSASLCTREDQ